MAARKRSKLPPIQSILMVPVLIVMYGVMWAMGKLGLRRQGVSVFTRIQQSPRIKRSAFQGYQPTARDVLVCTYSKSGTNWMMQIAYQIASRGQGTYEHIHDVVPWPDAPMPSIVSLHDDATYAEPTGLRVIKTHLESQHVPYSSAAKYIIVTRDPKEAFVSSYFFSRGMMPTATMVSVDEWLDLFVTNQFQYGSWAEHLAGYWRWRDRPNVLWLRFDELLADLPGAVRRVAVLMGVELTDDELALVVEKSSFAYMKAIDHKFVPQPPPLIKVRQVMLRNGRSGQASELITPAQQAAIDRFAQSELRRFDSDFPYAEMFTTVQEPSLAA